MLFTELMHAISPHLMGDGDVPSFMRDLIQRFCDVPETDWYTRRDPSSETRYRDSSLYRFYNKGPTKKLAKAILNHPNQDRFTASINYESFSDPEEDQSLQDMRIALSNAIQPFADVDVDESNVGEVLFYLIRQSLEFVVNPELENDRKLHQATSASEALKGTLGSRLLEECKYTCSATGCGTHLQAASNTGVTAPLYAIARISGQSREYSNLVALCPQCFHNYVLGHRKADEAELHRNKKIQIRSAQARNTLTTVDIERGISKVVEKLGNAKAGDFEALNYEPVAVKEKIDAAADFFIFDEVVQHVTRYFRFIEKELRDQAQLGAFDDDLLRAQIKASYRKLSGKGYSKQRIYDALTLRLSQITKQDSRYCAFIVSYFVQSCEVFDAAT